MKRITIPLLNNPVFFYSGKNEWLKYKKDCIEDNLNRNCLDDPCPEHREAGRCFAGRIWVKDLKCLPTIIHELSHLTDNVLEYRKINDTETRACVYTFLYEQAIKWSKQK
jgi:hypothetical protein